MFGILGRFRLQANPYTQKLLQLYILYPHHCPLECSPIPHPYPTYCGTIQSCCVPSSARLTIDIKYAFTFLIILKVRKKAKVSNRYNQAPHLTQQTTWESNKNTIKHQTQESQRVSHFPAGDHKATTNSQTNLPLSLIDYFLTIHLFYSINPLFTLVYRTPSDVLYIG